MRIMRLASLLAILALATPAAAQDVNAAPNYGTLDLDAGFDNDPRVIAVQSGGDLDATRIANGCRGFISNAPDLRLTYNAGSTLPLILSVRSDADTTLVVNAPDGSWYCDDDGGNTGLNPSVVFSRPMSGRYEIWVGTYGSASLQKAELRISELYSE
jgi:hypothetical protein